MVAVNALGWPRGLRVGPEGRVGESTPESLALHRGRSACRPHTGAATSKACRKGRIGLRQ